MKTTFDWRCTNEDCEHEFELTVEYSTPVPAKTWGPPENCYPAEGGEFQIIGEETCPKCGTKVDEEKVSEKFFDQLETNERDYEY